MIVAIILLDLGIKQDKKKVLVWPNKQGCPDASESPSTIK